MRLSPLAILAVSTLAAGSVLAKQAAPLSVKMACEASANSLCKAEVASGKHGQIRACLLKNLEKASPDCQTAIKTAQEHAAEMRAKGEIKDDAKSPKDKAPGQ